MNIETNDTTKCYGCTPKRENYSTNTLCAKCAQIESDYFKSLDW